MSLSCIVNWLCNFLVGLLFPFMQELLGPLSFIPFGCVLCITYIYVYNYLPETYGRTVEEIQQLVGVDDRGGAGIGQQELELSIKQQHIVHGVDNYTLDNI